jgi:hypothetical protein
VKLRAVIQLNATVPVMPTKLMYHPMVVPRLVVKPERLCKPL